MIIQRVEVVDELLIVLESDIGFRLLNVLDFTLVTRELLLDLFDHALVILYLLLDFCI